MKKAAVKIIVVVAMAAAVFVNAVVPVGATEANIYSYDYIAVDYFGIIYLSNNPLTFAPFDISSSRSDASHIGITSKNNEAIIILVPSEAQNGINYDIYIGTAGQVGYSSFIIYNPFTKAFSTQSTEYIYYSGSSTRYESYNQFAIQITALNRFDAVQDYYTIVANHEIGTKVNGNYPTTTILPENITIDSKLDINDYLQEPITKTVIESAITEALQSTTTEIINNQSTIINLIQTTNSYLTTVNSNLVTLQQKQDIANNHLSFIQTGIENIYNVGEGNKIPDNGPGLSQAQQQLHQSEEALTNKSESLASRASSGINTAKTASTQFVSTITPAVTAVNGTVTKAIESLPQEIQPMVYSMPLLSFAVWLIGLKR